MKVAEIFESEYSGETFRGFDQIQHSFETLEHIIKNKNGLEKSIIERQRCLSNC